MTLSISGVTIEGNTTTKYTKDIYPRPVVPPTVPELSLDAGNPASYPGSGATWTSVGSAPYSFTLYNNPTYSNDNGGYLSFNPSSDLGQYAQTGNNLGNLPDWTIEAWYYRTTTNFGNGVQIFTEVLGTDKINLALGNPGGSVNDMAAFYVNSSFVSTGSSYILPTTNSWYYLAGTFDGTSLNLYVNGVLTRTNASASSPGSLASNNGYKLMSRWDIGGVTSGRLGIVNVYNYGLSYANIRSNWLQNKARFGL
jgi:hypothetical protein